MTAVLLLAWLTAMAAMGLLAAIHTWHPVHYRALAARMAGWCTCLTLIAVTLGLGGHP